MHRSLVALALLALAFPVTARAEDAAVLYDPATVALIDLAIPVESREALAADPGEYVDATFTLEAGELAFGPHPVEVRLKGSTSFRPLGGKAAFKVKFPKEHRLLGLKSLTLNNMVQDPSMVREALGYEILRAAGVAAPHAGYAYVRVNGDGYGLYLNLETYDDVSMERLFDSTQHLYEADVPRVDLAPGGASAFEVEEGDEDDLADLEALIAAANATGGDWSHGIGRHRGPRRDDAHVGRRAVRRPLGRLRRGVAGHLPEQLLPAQRRGRALHDAAVGHGPDVRDRHRVPGQRRAAARCLRRRRVVPAGPARRPCGGRGRR
jgi:hypothetical protein